MTGQITLVTGSTGFIGGQLIRPGDRALVRRYSGKHNEILGDICQPETLRDACRGVRSIFHCAGIAHIKNARNNNLTNNVNFHGTKNLLKVAGELGVKNFVYISSVKAMPSPGQQCVDEEWQGIPDDEYGLSKLKAEKAVLEAGQKYGMNVVNLRLAMVYGRNAKGNLDAMAKAINAGWFPPLPETGNRRSLVHVSDVVEAARLVLGNKSANQKTYIVAHPEAVSGKFLYDALCEALIGCRRNWFIPERFFRFSGFVGDVVEQITKVNVQINSKLISCGSCA
jgi:UDP-glucose 4-epimerase